MSRFISSIIATVVIAASSISVHAQEKKEHRQFQYVVNAGFTFGGDTIDTARFTDGTSEKIKAGDLLQFGGGMIWAPSDTPISAQVTINYHVTDSAGKNGSLRFSRIPVEAAVFYTGVNEWRFGGGLRSVQSPHYSARIDNTPAESVNFKSTIGTFLEVGYALSPNAWINVRYTSEKFQVSSYRYGSLNQSIKNGAKVDGSHIGIGASFQF